LRSASFFTAVAFAHGEALQRGDFVQGLDLRRHEAGVLEDAVSHAQLFGHERVVGQIERLARAGQVVKLAARDGLGDAAFRDEFQHF
jgi:hypothetical protein